MTSLSVSGSGNPIPVTYTEPAPGAWRPPADGASPNAIRLAQETLAVLQTTLSLEPLLRLFSRTIASQLPHSGIRFANPDLGVALQVGRQARHECAFTLNAERKRLGDIVLHRGTAFTTDEAALLEYLFSSLVFPLRNALDYLSAVQASQSDPLTGVHNRAYLDEALEREVALSRRHRLPLSLIVSDIDDFKEVNDEHGHVTGDDVICTVAERMRDCLRKTDIFARYGGDEFTVLLPSTARRGAAVLARDIRDTLAEAPVAVNGSTRTISVSMGIASLNHLKKSDDLFARADAALYEAKAHGPGHIGVASSRSCRILPPRATDQG